MTTFEEAAKRDSYACRLCGNPEYQIHHITFRSRGGTDAVDNLVCLCQPCHDSVHNHTIKLHVVYDPFDIYTERLR